MEEIVTEKTHPENGGREFLDKIDLDSSDMESFLMDENSSVSDSKRARRSSESMDADSISNVRFSLPSPGEPDSQLLYLDKKSSGNSPGENYINKANSKPEICSSENDSNLTNVNQDASNTKQPIRQSSASSSKDSLCSNEGVESEEEDDNSEDESDDTDDDKADDEDNTNQDDSLMEVDKGAEAPSLPENKSCSTALTELSLGINDEESMDVREKRPMQSETEPKQKKRKLTKEKKKGKKNSGSKKKSDGKKPAKKRKAHERKNIRDILKEDELESETVAAQEAELERRKRLMELKTVPNEEETTISLEEKDSELRSLLEAAENEVSVEKSKSVDDIILVESEEEKCASIPIPVIPIPTQHDVITLSSDDEDESQGSKSVGVGNQVTLDDDDDDDEDGLSGSQEDEDTGEDPNDSGFHINDDDNQPDIYGRVLVNVKHPSEDPDIYLAPQIARVIKPHQIGGIRFLYDNLVESLSRFDSSAGFGCILAHSMGLGKTIQLIAFIDVFLRETTAKTVLCILPINTLQNWMSEFNMWLPSPGSEALYEGDRPRTHRVFLLNDSHKTMSARAKVIEDWCTSGGVLLMGYEMYRLLCSRKTAMYQKPKKTKKAAGPEIIDLEEEDRNKSLLVDIQAALVRPGPDLVVCDEGHRIKNSCAGISQSLKNIRTRRRVVLTGYPLQNNLLEYWCMVDFVRPNYLGSKTEFCNMFERPIMNGQCMDSTMKDIKIMRYRAHVLHSLLEGFVQRRGHTVLRYNLPPKQEFVFLVKLSPIQRALYKEFMESIENGSMSWETTNPLKAFSVCCKIWNHPDVLHKILAQKRLMAADDDLDIDESKNGEPGKAKKKKRANNAILSEKNVISYDWAEPIMASYTEGLLENSGKILILFEILQKTLARGEKLLVFSQSLFTLNIIEEFLGKRKVPRENMDENWCKNRNYFRLDGATAGTDREKLINQFNAPDNDRVWLFLLSTRAGSLGINLIGANRVVVMDASWNPCHDCQAVCRVYRYGQQKNCYVYRLVSENTLEKKIYERQINKQGMSDRVVDELNPENNFSRGQVESLLHFEDKDFPPLDVSNVEDEYTDDVIVETMKSHSQWMTKLPFTHESLLIDKKELRLSKQEKRIAKQSYAMEKKLNVSYSRPSYAAYYPRGGGAGGRYSPRVVSPKHGRPIASVKPIMSTPVPIQGRPAGNNSSLAIQQLVRPGVSVHQVITTTDIVLPGANTATNSRPANRISAGQNVLVIKTTKGVYIRTGDGKIFAVRSRADQQNIQDGTQTSPSQACSTSTTTTTSVSGNVNPLVGMAKQVEKTLQGQGDTSVNKKSDLLANIYAQTANVNSLLKNKSLAPLSSKTVKVLPSKAVTSVMPVKVVTSKSTKGVTSILPSMVISSNAKSGIATSLLKAKKAGNLSKTVISVKPVSVEEKGLHRFSNSVDDSLSRFSDELDSSDEISSKLPVTASDNNQGPNTFSNSIFNLSTSSSGNRSMPQGLKNSPALKHTPWRFDGNNSNKPSSNVSDASFRTTTTSSSALFSGSTPIPSAKPFSLNRSDSATNMSFQQTKSNLSGESTPADSLDDDSLLDDLFDDDDMSSDSFTDNSAMSANSKNSGFPFSYKQSFPALGSAWPVKPFLETFPQSNTMGNQANPTGNPSSIDTSVSQSNPNVNNKKRPIGNQNSPRSGTGMSSQNQISNHGDMTNNGSMSNTNQMDNSMSFSNMLDNSSLFNSPNTLGNSNFMGNSNPIGNSDFMANSNLMGNSNPMGNSNSSGNTGQTNNTNPMGNTNQMGSSHQTGNSKSARKTESLSNPNARANFSNQNEFGNHNSMNQMSNQNPIGSSNMISNLGMGDQIGNSLNGQFTEHFNPTTRVENSFMGNSWPSPGMQQNSPSSFTSEPQILDLDSRTTVETDKVMRVPPQRQKTDFPGDGQNSMSGGQLQDNYNRSKFPSPVPFSQMGYNMPHTSPLMAPNPMGDFHGYPPMPGYHMGHGYGQYPPYSNFNPYNSMYPPMPFQPPHLNMPNESYSPFHRSHQPYSQSLMNMDSGGVLPPMYPNNDGGAMGSSNQHRIQSNSHQVSQNNTM